MKPKSSLRSGADAKAPRSGADGKSSRGGDGKSPRSGTDGKSSHRAASGHASRGAEPSQRQLRVAEEFRHLLAEVFSRVEFHDRQLHGARLTISEVRMSPDLKHATVFITQLGNQDVTSLLPALGRAAPFLRGQIAPKLGLRITPDLKFLADAALDEATRMNRLLRSPDVARDLEG